MRTISIILGYLKWHYGRALYSLAVVWKNFLYFISEFFSLGRLFRNFFDPWKRMVDRYPKSFDLKKYFYAFVTNLIVRTVGILMRTGLILIGLSALIILLLLFPLALAVWLLLPLLVIGLIGYGLFFIIK